MVECCRVRAGVGVRGAELYRDAVRADRFLTIDRWQNEEDWQSFLHAFGAAYESLDAQLEGLAAPDRHIAFGLRRTRSRRNGEVTHSYAPVLAARSLTTRSSIISAAMPASTARSLAAAREPAWISKPSSGS